MVNRSGELQDFLSAAEIVLGQGPSLSAEGSAHVQQVFEALRMPAVASPGAGAGRLPVCGHLAAALDAAGERSGSVAALAAAFARVEPSLTWKHRAGAEAVGEPFLSGHANAILVGADGFEVRGDVQVGVSLLAPFTPYPRHRHPPKEIYIAMSDGEWMQDDGPWFRPGFGGLVFNPANHIHAMRSGAVPLLTFWFLWTLPA